MEQLERYWRDAMSIIEEESTAVSFETWFVPIIPYALEDDCIYLQVDNPLAKDMLEKRYYDVLKNAIRTVTKRDYNIVILQAGEKPAHASLDKKKANIPRNLNPKYVFSSFVVGNSNRMAHAASLAVAEAPAKNYNPLFLYGNSGLGKTHLMHSIAHYILDHNPEANILYVTSETFTNELVLSIQNNRNESFRNKYRNIDVLLIDDIQFISKKEGTQEEFFHTFNALYESSKQIIISSDRPPKEIETLEERLRSRFEMGLIADIQQPDYETRLAILKKKAERDNLMVPDDVLSYIATSIVSNIRELEGALTRIVAYATLTNQDITIALAENSIRDVFNEKAAIIITPQYIQQVVAEYYNIRVEDIQGAKKPKNIAFPRQVSMYLCRKLLDISLPKIGESFGGRDHTTVIHAISKIEKLLEQDEELQNTILKIEGIIKGQ